MGWKIYTCKIVDSVVPSYGIDFNIFLWVVFLFHESSGLFEEPQ